MKWYLSIFITILSFSTLVMGVKADFELRDWRYYRVINLPLNITSYSLVEIHPVASLFSDSFDGLADIRIIDKENIEIPYKLEISGTDLKSKSVDILARDKSYLIGGPTTFVVEIGNDISLHNQLDIGGKWDKNDLTASNFQRTITVESSDDALEWREIANQPILGFHVSQFDRNTKFIRVTYPDNSGRYLRVKIFDDLNGYVDVSRLKVSFSNETVSEMILFPLSNHSISENKDNQTTIVTLDMGNSNFPTSKISLNIEDANFFRQISVEHSNSHERWASKRWILLGEYSIYRYDTEKFSGNKFEIDYPEIKSRYIRIIIHNQDSMPLNIMKSNIWGLARKLIFEVQEYNQYFIYYGNEKATMPVYDINKFLMYSETTNLPSLSIGPQLNNPAFERKLNERVPWLLPGVISVITFIVAGLLFGILRKAKLLFPPPPPS